MSEFLFSPEEWFKKITITDELTAIREPHHGQDVISYHIKRNGTSTLIDSGMGLADISKVINEADKTKLFLTHSHWDHIGGASLFKDVFIGENEYELERTRNGWGSEEIQGLSGDFITSSPDITQLKNFTIRGIEHIQSLHDREKIQLIDDLKLQVIHTPGHTPGSVCYFIEERGWLFTGDTLYPGPEYLHLPEANLSDYLKSLKKLKNILGQKVTSIFPGHNEHQYDPSLLENHLFALKGLSVPTIDYDGQDEFGKYNEQKWNNFALRFPRSR